MATLERIRSKSVLLIIVIGVALLAFIIGDAITNSRNIFGDHTTVAKVGGTKIDYTDYQRKREELNNRLEEGRRQNPQQFANFDTQILPQMALEQLVQEKLLSEAADKAGIKASGNVLRYYMLENPQSERVIEIVRQLNGAGVSVQTPQQAYEVIFNPKRNGMTDAQMEPYQRAWIAAEKEMGNQISMMVYQRLLAGAVQPNELDKKALYNDYVATSGVDIAFLPYGKLDEKTYKVSDADVKAAYDEERGNYKVEEPTKEISFISVNVAPSAEDRTAATELAAKTVANLQKNTVLDKDVKKEGVSLTRHTLRATDLPAGAIKDYVLSAPADSVKLVTSGMGGFTVVKMIGRTNAVDSVQVNVVATASETLGNRVLSALNSGLSVDSISSKFSADSVAPQLNQWIPLYTADGPTQALPKETLDSLRNAGGKFISINAGPQGMVMAQLVKQKEPVAVYEYQEASYTLSPSTKTLGAERDKLEKFLAENNTAAKFNENAAKAGYNLQKFTLNASSPAVPRFQGFNQYYPDSRQVVRWVMMDAEEGEVSHIYESKSANNPVLYAAAVDSEYDEYVPLTNEDVKTAMTEKARRAKAGDALYAKYSKQAATVDGAAKAMGVEVKNYPSFRFGRNSGVADQKVIGKIAGSKADKKAVMVKGDDGIYVYVVSATNTEKFPYNGDQYTQQYFQLVNPDMVGMLKGSRKVKNNIYKFEAGD